jgi:micrococcal nuclease
MMNIKKTIRWLVLFFISVAGCTESVPPGADEQSALYRANTAQITQFGDAELSRMVKAEVLYCSDGDTVRVHILNPPPELKAGDTESIRLIGVDTPETVHPSKPVAFFGKEASDFTKAELSGKEVYLLFDWDLRDIYDRLLAYIYTEGGGCFNARLIREGYGYALTFFPFQFLEEFAVLEAEAQNEERGLWDPDLKQQWDAAHPESE